MQDEHDDPTTPAARVDRRRLLVAAAGASGLLGACAAVGLPGAGGPAAMRPAGPWPFSLGVASGYPTADGVVLWTRLLPEEPASLPQEAIPVAWEIARDESMRSVVARGQATAVPSAAHSVRVVAAGLEPARWYWYRFTALGHRSRTGRTRTLPRHGDAVDRLRIAVASCQNREHGSFAAYRHVAAADPDLIVHVGDYIYEASWGTLVRPLRLPEARTLSDYRERHAIWKRDALLQEAHARHPWLMVWDDHEVSNDYAGASPERITPPEDFLRRRAAAYQAYYEHMPMPARMAPRGPDMRIFDTVRVGSLATLHLLDWRQYRTPQACPRPGRAGAAHVVPGRCPDLQHPGRTVLGAAQEQWLDRRFAESATTWNLLAQQSLLAPLWLPGSGGAPARVRTDGWDGYPGSRRRLLESLAEHRVRNPVILGGDLHAFFVADIRQDPAGDSPVVATELVTTSISSQAADAAHYAALRAANPHLRHADGSRRGYLLLDMRGDSLEASLMGLDDVTREDSGIRRQARFVVEAGRPGAGPA
jgi:alkaline phosphatase D